MFCRTLLKPNFYHPTPRIQLSVRPSVRPSPFLTCITHACIIDKCFIRISILHSYMDRIHVMDTCIVDTCIVDTCIVVTWIMDTYIMDTFIIDTCIMDTCIMDTCFMETCIMDTSAWVTRPECPKVRKLEVGAQQTPKLLVIIIVTTQENR